MQRSVAPFPSWRCSLHSPWRMSFLSTGTESRLVSNDKICLFFATRQAIQFRKRNMNGEFALTATPSFCVTSNAKTSNIANRRRKRAKGFPLGTPTSNSALLRRVVGISYSQTQRPKVKYDDLRAVCFKFRVTFAYSTHKRLILNPQPSGGRICPRA